MALIAANKLVSPATEGATPPSRGGRDTPERAAAAAARSAAYDASTHDASDERENTLRGAMAFLKQRNGG